MPLGSAQVLQDLQIQHYCTDIYSHRRSHMIAAQVPTPSVLKEPGNERRSHSSLVDRCAARLLFPGDPISVA
jgi:hypothetical protein